MFLEMNGELTHGPNLTQQGDMASGSRVAVKTSQNRGKTATMAICKQVAKFDGQRFLVLGSDISMAKNGLYLFLTPA